MNESRDRHALSVTDTARGIAIRARVLTVVTIVVGTWLFSLGVKAASELVKIFAGVLLLAIGGGVAAWEVRKVRKQHRRVRRVESGAAVNARMRVGCSRLWSCC